MRLIHFLLLFIIITFKNLLIAFQNPLFAQTLVQDTLLVSFEKLDTLKSEVFIDTIIDGRGEDPNHIGIYEKTRYLFVPVDLLIYTGKPLNTALKDIMEMPENNDSSIPLRLIVDEFTLQKKSSYLLYSSISLYQKSGSNGNGEFKGQLLYETAYKNPIFRDNLKKGFESVTQNWHREFCSDLTEISQAFKNGQTPVLANFRKQPYSGRRVNMITGIDFIAGNHGWITDGEIYFSHREARNKFTRSGYNIRYRHGDTYESIEFGVSDRYLFYRWRNKSIFRLKSQFMIGFNRWNDYKTVNHKIWDAFIIDYSINQSLIYNPLDKRSLVFGIGLHENIYYIYSKRLKLQFGLLLNIGLKL